MQASQQQLTLVSHSSLHFEGKFPYMGPGIIKDCVFGTILVVAIDLETTAKGKEDRLKRESFRLSKWSHLS